VNKFGDSGFSFEEKGKNIKTIIAENLFNENLFEEVFQSHQRVQVLIKKAIEYKLINFDKKIAQDKIIFKYRPSNPIKISLFFDCRFMPVGANYNIVIKINGIEEVNNNSKLDITNFILPYFKKRNMLDGLEDSFRLLNKKVFLHIADFILNKKDISSKYNLLAFGVSLIKKMSNKELIEKYINYKSFHVYAIDEYDQKKALFSISLASKKMRSGEDAVEILIDNFEKAFIRDRLELIQASKEDILDIDMVVKRTIQPKVKKGLKIVKKAY